MRLLDKLEKKFGRNFGIRNLMLYIVMINLLVFFMDIVGFRVDEAIGLVPSLVKQGQVWRLITFIFIPPNRSMFWIAFALYLYYMIGSTLENVWGTFRFNLFYLIGILGIILASFIANSSGTPYYLNMSLFLAFAAIFPNYELLVFFVLPVKIKWLAYIDIAILGYSFITGGMATKLFILFSLLNVILFFGANFISSLSNKKRKRKFQKAFEPRVVNNVAFHKCTVCGITEKDDPDMQFRYCSKCNGTYEYCMDHLHNHEHVKE